RPEQGFFKPDQAWVWNNGTLRGPVTSFFHGGSCWTRKLFDAAGGYAAEGAGEDRIFEQRLAHAFPGATETYAIRPDDIYYLYRWFGTESYHLSGFGDYKAGANIGHHEVAAYVQKSADSGRMLHGHIHLRPHWKQDYRQ